MPTGANVRAQRRCEPARRPVERAGFPGRSRAQADGRTDDLPVGAACGRSPVHRRQQRRLLAEERSQQRGGGGGGLGDQGIHSDGVFGLRVGLNDAQPFLRAAPRGWGALHASALGIGARSHHPHGGRQRAGKPR